MIDLKVTLILLGSEYIFGGNGIGRLGKVRVASKYNSIWEMVSWLVLVFLVSINLLD